MAGLAGSAYFHRLSRPGHVTRAGLEPLVGEIWARAANGCGHRQIRMCLVHGFGRRVSAKTVLRVMRRMGLKCPIRAADPWRRYGSYGGDAGGKVPNLLKRDFGADGPFARLGAGVAEFKVAGSKAYLAPVYDMAGKEIVAWDVSRHPGMDQRKRPLAMLGDKLPDGANPIPHSDMGWRYQRPWWRKELERLNIRRSMSRKGNRLDNACISSSRCFVFSHVFFSGLGSCMHFPYFSGCAEVFLPNMRASLTRRLWPVNSRSRPWCTMRSMIAAASLSSAKTVPHLLNSMFVVNMMLRLS